MVPPADLLQQVVSLPGVNVEMIFQQFKREYTDDEGADILNGAVESGNEEIVKLLLTRGFKVFLVLLVILTLKNY